MKTIRFFLFIAALVLAACMPIQPEETPSGTATPVPGDAVDDLAGTQWQLISFGPAENEMPAVPGAMVTLEFGADGHAGGNSGCNSYGGPYTVEGDTITFGEMVSTLMACADTSVMEQEGQYLDALSSAGHFALEGDQLTLWYGEDDGQLNFVALPPLAGESPDADEPPVDEVAERVDFESGSTATLSGTLSPGDDKQYALAASAGQRLHVQTVGYGAPISVTIHGPDGTTWTGEQLPAGAYIVVSEITTPETGDYLIILSSSPDAAETSYDVAFTIGTSATQPMTPQPDPVDRIVFEPGTNSAERSGLLPSGPGIQQYLISAPAGQTLTVDATSDGTPLSMTIESPSGQQWIPEMMPDQDGYRIGHQLDLPEPGYYLVTLNKADHTPSTNYTITFTLE